MSDDLVTRLRAYDLGSVAHESEYHMCEVLAEAADDIERLRTEITELQTRLRDTYKERDYWEWASRGE